MATKGFSQKLKHDIDIVYLKFALVKKVNGKFGK